MKFYKNFISFGDKIEAGPDLVRTITSINRSVLTRKWIRILSFRVSQGDHPYAHLLQDSLFYHSVHLKSPEELKIAFDQSEFS